MFGKKEYVQPGRLVTNVQPNPVIHKSPFSNRVTFVDENATKVRFTQMYHGGHLGVCLLSQHHVT